MALPVSKPPTYTSSTLRDLVFVAINCSELGGLGQY